MSPSTLIALAAAVVFIAVGGEIQTRWRHRRIAKHVFSLLRAAEWTRANPAEAPALNTPHVEDAIAEFEKEGFRLLGDIKQTNASRSIQVRVLCDGESGVAIQAVTALSLPQVVMEVESESRDGRILRVVSGLGGAVLQVPPEVTRVDVAEATPGELLARHRKELDSWASGSDTGLELVRVESLEDVLASQIRQEAARANRRNAIGLTHEEAVRLVGEGGAKRLLKEFQRLREGPQRF